MATSVRREALVLFVGDIVFLAFSLWVTLTVRYASVPDWHLLSLHFAPFSFLFLLSTVIFLIAGLYEKHTLLMKSKLPETVLSAQAANVLAGAALFFLVPYFGIAPRANLFIYLLFSTVFISLWRLSIFPRVAAAEPQPALLVGDGPEAEELFREINGNTRYVIHIIARSVETDTAHTSVQAMAKAAHEAGAEVIIAPLALIQKRYAVSEDGMVGALAFVDFEELYEELFDRVPLPFLSEQWFSDVEERTPTRLYDVIKRAGDIVLSVIALAALSPFLFVIALALAPGGSPFIFQARIGRHGREIRIIKLRTMLFDDGEDPEKKKLNRITRFGAFLRKTQFDEVPQFWNVLMGDLSLIGPRPEIPHFVSEYEREIPYYGARHMIQPGISGWAQIKHASPPKFRLDVEATRNKLSYDLYYLKHRSLLLDVVVILQTIKILLARASK